MLLEDCRYLADSFWKNGQTGETRVNWFVGIAAAVASGLVTLASAEFGPSGATLHLIIIAALFTLLVFGIVTLLRIMKRNAVTDGYKRDRDAIRQIFRDHFDGDHTLLYYQPFGSRCRLEVAAGDARRATEDGSPGEKRGKGVGRQIGGLAHMVSAINSLLIASLAGAIHSVLAAQVPDGVRVHGVWSGSLTGWSTAPKASMLPLNST